MSTWQHVDVCNSVKQRLTFSKGFDGKILQDRAAQSHAELAAFICSYSIQLKQPGPDDIE